MPERTAATPRRHALSAAGILAPPLGRHDLPPHRLAARLLLWAAALCAPLTASGEDWPTYRGDNQRSGITAESLGLPLEEAWVYRSPSRPLPAWGPPARADYYTTSQVPLKPRLAFDRALHVAVAGGFLYFGSSLDDSVHAIDVRDGREVWSTTTDAPVRMAPSVWEGKVYAGSDDGSLYCLHVATGAVRWRFTAAGEDNILVPSDGRFVSPWCVRSGVAVEGGVAYFSAGIFPAEGVTICAVNAEDGSLDGPNLWRRLRRNDVTLQGYILLSPSRVYLPAGRSSPYLFSRSEGQLLGQFYAAKEGARGTFALLAGTRLFTGPAARGGALIEELDAYRPGQDALASYTGGNSLVVSDSTSYLLSDEALTALERSSRRVLWRRQVSYPYEVILAGGLVFAGGKDEVAAFDAATGTTLWAAGVEGKAYGLAAANGFLFASTDRGVIHAFRSSSTPENAFIRGDVNGDGGADLSDAIGILAFLFRGSVALTCQDHGDTDDNGRLDLTDALVLLRFLFRAGPPPPEPYPTPGLDPTADGFGCGDPR